MAPHLSADDGPLSRLTRHGVRATRAELDRLTARGLLKRGLDWNGDGALEHRIRSSRSPALPEATSGGSRPAHPGELAAAGLPADAQAVWHPQAGWVKPGALVRAWLAEAGVTFVGNARVERLQPRPMDAATSEQRGQQTSHGLADASAGSGAAPIVASGWQALDASGRVLGEAPLVVVAAALGSATLVQDRLRLQPVRGQVSWGLRRPSAPLPPFPVNGNGHLLTAVPLAEGLAWLSGSSYGHGETGTEVRSEDHDANLDRIRALLPAAGEHLAHAFEDGTIHAWTGIRCASTDRRPLVGSLVPGLWVLTALGSRGLTLSALCAQLLAARLSGDTPPVPADLAAALDLARQPGSN